MIDKSVALVTGASQGIGRSIARKFTQEGYVTVLAARNKEGLEETAKLIEQNNGDHTLVVPSDLRNSEDIARLVDTTLNEWGKIDILINNAGILHLKPFLELSLDEFQEMLDVNIRAIFELTQKVIPSMIERKQGTIINIASLAGKNGFKTGTGYSATKYALRGFAASLMMEVREHDIRVVTVFPGSVDTGMIARNPQGAKNKLKPEDVAHAVYSATVVDSRAMMSEIDIRPSNPHK